MDSVSVDIPTDARVLQFVQLSIAVVLLHVAALVSSRVVLPELDPTVALQLAPVMTVGVIGLVFNTLCLRAVDASFFQVRSRVLTYGGRSYILVFQSRLLAAWFCQ